MIDAKSLSRFFTINIPLNGAVNFDGVKFTNGFTQFNGGALQVTKNKNLQVKNSIFHANHSVLTGSAISDQMIAPNTIKIDKTFFTNNISDTSGYALVTYNADMQIKNSGFDSNVGGGISSGGAVSNFSNVNKLVISNSSLTNNSSTFGAGGINIESNSSATIDAVTFTNNGTDSVGGALINMGNATIANSTFSTNTATLHDGAVFNQGTISQIDNATMVNNIAQTGDGGGINNDQGVITLMKNSTIDNNTAAKQGGGIMNWGTFDLDGVHLNGNSAETGGGIMNYVGSLKNVYINTNKASKFGGGIFNNTNVSLDFDAGDLKSNNAGIYGGAIYNKGFVTNLKFLIIDNNTSNQSGAGIMNGQQGTIDNISDTSISFNNADFDADGHGAGGGAIHNDGNIHTVINVTMDGNSASQGGAVSNWGTIIDTNNLKLLNNTADKYGGGILNTGTIYLNRWKLFNK